MKVFRKTIPHQLRAALIDRLIDLEPLVIDERRPLRTMSVEEVKACLQRDLTWLLNTRTALKGEQFDETELTVIHYGMPDFGKYSAVNLRDRKLIARRIKRSIEAFEPRLQDLEVIVRPDRPDEKRLFAVISATLVIDQLREPMKFTTILDEEKGRWEVHGEL